MLYMITEKMMQVLRPETDTTTFYIFILIPNGKRKRMMAYKAKQETGEAKQSHPGIGCCSALRITSGMSLPAHNCT